MSIQSEINRLKNNVAATYAAMEEQGATMPTQQNSANMAATARTIPTGGGGGTTVQADLAVNDPSNARYVKNRTHWKEVYDGPEGEVIPETSVAFTTNIKIVTGAMSDAIKVGGKYIVTWNGTDYECVGKSGSDGNYIGNGSFMNAGNMTFEDTGEPFCVLLFGGTYYQLWKADKTAETITVKVVGKKETVWHKLDSRFLNEALQFGETVTASDTVTWDGNTDGMVCVEIDVGVGLCKVSDSVVTKEDCANGVVVTVDGADLPLPGEEIQAMFSDDDFCGIDAFAFVPYGNYFWADIGMAFPEAGVYFLYADGMFISKLAISGYSGFIKREVKKLDGKYLPDGVPYVESGSADIIPETTIELYPESGAGYLLDKVGLNVGDTYAVKWNGAEYNCVAQDAAIPIDENGNTQSIGVCVGDFGLAFGGESTGEPFLIVAANAIGEQQFGVPTLIQALDGSASVVLSISGKGKVVHKMDADCLPAGTPGVAYHGDVIISDITVLIADGIFAITEPVGVVSVGAKYEVRIGQELYYCVAEPPVLGGAYACFYNAALPFSLHFIIPASAAESGTYCYGNFASEYNGAVLSVSAAYTVKQTDERCMVGANFFVVNATADDSVNIESVDMSFYEVRWRILNGGIPVLMVHTNSGNVHGYHFTLFTSSHIKFVCLEGNKTALWQRGDDVPTT